MAFGTLLLLHPDGSRNTVSLEKTTVRVGRAADNDIVLALPQVADYHAQLLCDATGIQVLNLGSPVGTAIDDQKLEQYGLAPFRFGQRLQIGPIWILHHQAAPSSPPEPTQSGWFWRPGWWERWRAQARGRRADGFWSADNFSAPGQGRVPQTAPASASTSAPATAERRDPSPSLVEHARSWHPPEWLKRIFIWSWLKQNGHRTLSWVLDLVGFFWLRSFLSRWFGISPDMLNPMQLLDDKEPAPHHRSDAAPDPTLERSAPQRGSPPTPPTLPVRRSEELHLAIEPTQLTADPGRTVALTVTVVNRSSLVDRVCFLVDGLPDTWISITPPTLSLMPGDSGSSEIVIRPPRDATSVAGTHPFVVAARSSESSEPEAAVAVSLAITPFHDFRLDVQPQHCTAWRRGHYELRIINNSNQTQLFALQGRDEAQALLFDFQPAQPLIGPGVVASVQVTVRHRRPHLLGKPISSPFHLLVEPAHRGEPAQQAQGRLTQRALSWSLLLLLLLLPIFAYSLSFAPYAFKVAEATINKNPIPTPSRELFPPIPTGLPQLSALWPSSATPQPSNASSASATPSAAAAQGHSPTTTAGVETTNGAGTTTLLEALGMILGIPPASAGQPDDQAASGETPLNTDSPGPPSSSAASSGDGVVPVTDRLPAFGEPIILADALTEGQTNSPGYTVAELLARLGYRAQSGGPHGLAVVGVAGGKWQYTADGVLWRDFPSQTSPAIATLLLGNATSRIRFVPGEDFNTEVLEPSAIPQIQVLAWNGTQFQNAVTGVDTGARSAGGIFGTTAATVLQRVIPVNDQPSFTLNLPTLVLTGTTRLVIARAATDVRAGPANERHQKLSYDIAVDPLCLAAAISDNGALTLSPRNNVLCAEQSGTVVLRDNGGTDNGGAEQSAPQTFIYTVDTRKQPPAWQNPRASMDILPEDPLSNSGLPVSEAILRLGYYDQQGGAGGLAVIGADNANGQWQYRSDGFDWRNMTTVSRLTPLLLRASATNHVRFVPSPDYADDAVLTVLPWNSRSWDAAAAFWAYPALLHQAVQPINDTPSFHLTEKTPPVRDTEMVTIGLFASAISPGPENEAGQQVEFAIELSGDVSSVFASQPKISSSGTLTFRAQPNQKVEVLARVSLRDSEQGVSAPATFTIVVDTLSSTMTAAANATGTAAVQTAAAQEIAAPAQTQTAQAMLTTVARTETAANRTATAAAVSYAATSYAATSYAATSYAATSYAYGTAAASATAIAATATRQSQETAIAATANTLAQATAYAATRTVAASTAQAQATANAIATATAIAQPQSLRIHSSNSLVAGRTMDVEVVVLDGRGQPVPANGYSISLRLINPFGGEVANFSSVMSVDGKATFTGVTFTRVGEYDLLATAEGLYEGRSRLLISPAPADRFWVSCFKASDQTGCQTRPVVFSADQQFGFNAEALDEYGNRDTNFSQPSFIQIHYGGGGSQVLWGTPAFKQGYLSFSTTDLPSQKVGTDFFYEFGAAYTGPARAYTDRFTVLPGAPAVIIPQGANTITLGSSSTYVSSVIVMDSRQNPVDPGVRVCFKTNSPGFFDPDLLFSNTPGRYAMIMMSTDASGIATAPQATSNGRPGSYTLYAYTRPDGGCDPALDLSAPPGLPYISVPFQITNE